MEEITWMKSHNVYTVVPDEESRGHKRVKVLWVDTNKGDDKVPDVRARLCARETKRSGGFEGQEAQLFAATPPLEGLKMLISMLMSRRFSINSRRLKMGFIDVKKAHLFGVMKRAVYIDLPPEDYHPGCCGRLNYSLYGTRDAANNFENTYADALTEHGYVRGVSNPCFYYHPSLDVMMLVHGDDFAILSDEAGIMRTKEMLETKFELKLRAVLGPDTHDSREVRVLNRLVRWVEDSDGLRVEYEADPRHQEIIIKTLKLESAKAVSTPMVKMKAQDYQVGSELLKKDEIRLYRSVTMRAQYLAQDRPDLQFSVKERARRMKAPMARDLVALKRVGRYLRGRPRLVQVFPFQSRPKELVCYCDTDHAGCLETRKSTSGVALCHGRHVLRTCPNTQDELGLSNGESEFYGAVKASSVMLGARAMASDFGCGQLPCKCIVRMDSNAGRAMTQRRGVGKMRHIDLRYLWVQQRVARGDVEVERVPGATNPSDMMTKALPEQAASKHLAKLNFQFRDGRSTLAPEVTGAQKSS